MIRAFPKIFTIGQDYIVDIFKNDVEVTEKIDGSQFNFGKVGGELFLRSKGAQIIPEAPQKMFQLAVDYVLSIQDKIPDNTTLYCEYLAKPKHNTILYDKVPEHNLILFGASDTTDKFTNSYELLIELATLVDIDIVSLIYYGKVKKIEDLVALLNTDSILGGSKVEGIVVKNYFQPFLLGGHPIPVMMGKLVSEEFKEVHQKEWKKTGRAKDRYTLFCEGFKTEARWQKAVQHLNDAGKLLNEPKDIGNLIKEVMQDIEEEEKESIKDFLWGEFRGQLMRTATKGLPEWYKEQLAKRSFKSD